LNILFYCRTDLNPSLLSFRHVLADRETTPPAEAEDPDKEDLDDEEHDEVAASGVEDNHEEKSETTTKDAEANAKDAVSMGSDGEL
jgi:hypothetical protein